MRPTVRSYGKLRAPCFHDLDGHYTLKMGTNYCLCEIFKLYAEFLKLGYLEERLGACSYTYGQTQLSFTFCPNRLRWSMSRTT